jgi:DNA primase
MVTAALIRSKDDRYFDLFRNRVMFPIIDVQGNVIAFGGRVLDDSKPKYLNSPDTPVFKKSRGLYALNFAKNGNNNNLILCEGYMDVIAMHQAGFKNAVATLGTALTPEQSRLMARYAKDVVVSYDSDEAGRKAAQRAIGLLTQAGIGVRVLNIEGGKDPDEFIKTHGADKFKLMLEKSGSHIEYRLTAAKAKYDLSKPDQKVEFLKEAANVLATVESLIEREVYAGRLSQELEISKDNLLSEVNRIVARGSSKKLRDGIRTELDASRGLKDRLNPLKVKYLKAAMAEESLIVLLYKNPDFLKTLDTLISPEDFMTEFNRRVYETERNLVLSGGEADLTAIGEQFTPEETGKITGMLMLRKVSNTIEEARDCAKVILEEKMLKSDNGIDALDKLEELRQKKLDKNTGGNYK